MMKGNFVYLETEDGELVRVPEDRLEQYLKAQEDVRSGRFKTSEQEIEQMLSLGRMNRQEQAE